MSTDSTRPAEPAVNPSLEKLQRDLTSAHVRNRTLFQALRRAASAPIVVGVLKGPDRDFDEIVFLSNGIRLEHRWDEQHGWRYVQAACIPTTLAAVVDGIFADPGPAAGGMVVVA